MIGVFLNCISWISEVIDDNIFYYVSEYPTFFIVLIGGLVLSILYFVVKFIAKRA